MSGRGLEGVMPLVVLLVGGRPVTPCHGMQHENGLKTPIIHKPFIFKGFIWIFIEENWSGRPGSNRRRSAWEADILPLNYSRKMPDRFRKTSVSCRMFTALQRHEILPLNHFRVNRRSINASLRSVQIFLVWRISLCGCK